MIPSQAEGFPSEFEDRCCLHSEHPGLYDASMRFLLALTGAFWDATKIV